MENLEQEVETKEKKMSTGLKVGLVVASILTTIAGIKGYERLDAYLHGGYEQRCTRSEEGVYCTLINRNDPQDVIYVGPTSELERHVRRINP